MKFSYHEISLFILKVQRILNKSRLGTRESELEMSLCHCLDPLGVGGNESVRVKNGGGSLEHTTWSGGIGYRRREKWIRDER